MKRENDLLGMELCKNFMPVPISYMRKGGVPNFVPNTSGNAATNMSPLLSADRLSTGILILMGFRDIGSLLSG